MFLGYLCRHCFAIFVPIFWEFVSLFFVFFHHPFWEILSLSFGIFVPNFWESLIPLLISQFAFLNLLCDDKENVGECHANIHIYIYMHVMSRSSDSFFWFDQQQLSINMHGSWGLNSPSSATCSERALCRTEPTIDSWPGRSVARSECMKPVARRRRYF